MFIHKITNNQGNQVGYAKIQCRINSQQNLEKAARYGRSPTEVVLF